MDSVDAAEVGVVPAAVAVALTVTGPAFLSTGSLPGAGRRG